MRESLILWPPQVPADNICRSTYQLFSEFIPLTTDQIKAFELRHLSTNAKNVKRKIRELHTNREKTTESYEYTSKNYRRQIQYIRHYQIIPVL